MKPSRKQQRLIKNNIGKITTLDPSKYPTLKHILKGTLLETLLSIYEYEQTHPMIEHEGQFAFFADNTALTHRIRKKTSGYATSNRHLNFLCCLGILEKVYQGKDRESLLAVNRKFLDQNSDKSLPINALYVPRLTHEKLTDCERRARILTSAVVTTGNISYNTLVLNGLTEMAAEVYFHNSPFAPERKAELFEMVSLILDMLIEDHGYATRQQVMDNLLITDAETEQLFKITKPLLANIYHYGRPTKTQKERFNLDSNSFIYTYKND